MEQRLQEALEFANYRQTLNNQLHKLKLRAEGLLLLSKNGGIFKISQELICFLDYLAKSDTVSANILDSQHIPVHIENISEFLLEVRRRYFEVTDDYLKEYQEIKKQRNVKSILGIKDVE
jgi:hypothetical protein